ncbi:hypothetical protein TPHA_0C01530 [Tetrapisispora phaffii CBS 4417]|uniref:Calponin-homology (CH) domain-containing protein n=1 Tax=Tetrapisispora phaffii (strain ATCC 24235 / CBS 4417 / NBRC 1672 / NRRL Y-8282 / UCD 70-5) TaxID=1071381 RepID=G8BRD3_TETPH|nr:hypothetical protein TPHA_0C01530 [Tetrapisispora phaffii CBS 4417]CCE62309.1 hypothetical protein TPHA_0C01530 [Tetrapisispora phaffii CBS 4417]
MSNIGESRTDLLNWLNELLQLNYRKIEECGTGAAYCQIFDSIYGDVPMHRVKFNATAEYDFQTNYKILQSCFTKHQIEKTVYVDKLIKCRFQDNLEFLQWTKRFWLQNKDEAPYDPNSRRKFKSTISSTPNTSNNGVIKNKKSTYGLSASSNAANIMGSSRVSSFGASRKASSEQLLSLQTELSNSHMKITNLNDELTNYKNSLDIMERERAFYFGKLRDIEILVQSTEDLIKEGIYNANSNSNSDELYKFIKKVQKILYATEEGFEVNDGDEGRIEDKYATSSDQRHQSASNDVINNNANDNDRNNEQLGLMPPASMGTEIDTTNLASQNLIIDEETF